MRPEKILVELPQMAEHQIEKEFTANEIVTIYSLIGALFSRSKLGDGKGLPTVTPGSKSKSFHRSFACHNQRWR